jgi:hypothetical protein
MQKSFPILVRRPALNLRVFRQAGCAGLQRRDQQDRPYRLGAGGRAARSRAAAESTALGMELLCCIRGGEGVNHVSSAGSQSVLAVHSRVLVLDTRRAPARHATAQVAGGRLDGSPSGFPEKILLLTIIGLMWKGRFGVPPFANRHRPLSVNDVLPRSLQLVGRHIRHRVVIVAEKSRRRTWGP